MRRWIGLLLTFSLFILLISGLILYIEPPGRIAFWTNWRFLGLSKHQWDNLHIVFGFLFLVFAFWHLILNFQSWKRYFIQAKPLLFGLFITVLVFWGTITYQPPFSWVIDWQQQIKRSWHLSPPPIPHAELMPLKKVAKFLGLKPRQAVEILRQKGIKVSSPQEIFGQIAQKNHRKPVELFHLLEEARPQNLLPQNPPPGQ